LAVGEGAATAVLASYRASTLYAADTRMAEPAAAPLLPAAAMSLGEAVIEEALEEAEAVAEEEEAEGVAPADGPPPTSLWTAPAPPPPPAPSPPPPLPSPPPPPAEAAVSMDETLQRSSALAALASLAPSWAPSTSASLGAVVPGVVPGGATPCSLAARHDADRTVPAAASAAAAPAAAAAVHNKPPSLLVLVVLGLESSVYLGSPIREAIREAIKDNQ